MERVDDLQNKYSNPILDMDYPDPDVIRQGNNFYMVSSSFHYVPGVPVLQSRDMIHWELINYVIREIPLPGYDVPRHGSGAWAPSIRFHNGLFWAFVPFPDEGVFVSHAEDPSGVWSPLHCIKEAKGWIDPCPFWDEDGQAYMIHAFAKSRIGINSVLAVSKMASDCSCLLGEDRIVYDGHQTQPVIEGPKLYKKDGFYYIFAPAGGVTNGWQTVLRSNNIWGPYTEKIVLEQGETDVNGPHQGAWVQQENGESWFYHFQEKPALGRVVHLQPMHWEDGWPVIGEGGRPIRQCDVPVPSEQLAERTQIKDTFDGKSLALEWQWNTNSPQSRYFLDKGLRLFAAQTFSGKLWCQPNLLLQKLRTPPFAAETILTQLHDARAGLAVTGQKYTYIMIEQQAGVLVLKQYTGDHTVQEDSLVQQEELRGALPLSLKLTVDRELCCRFSYRIQEGPWQPFGCCHTAESEIWTGTKVGIFTAGNNGGYAVFKQFSAVCQAAKIN